MRRALCLCFRAKVIDFLREKLCLIELKGLSHAIDFKNFDKNLQNLA
jgi:hypothetical protein